MKKLLLLLLSLSALNYSCFKKDNTTIIAPAQPPPPTPLIEYPIDLNFNINSSYYISFDSTNDYPWFREKNFYFSADSKSNLPNDTSGSNIYVSQGYSYYGQTYSDASMVITPNDQNSYPNQDDFIVQPIRNFNFFSLTYQSGAAVFSDTCYITAGDGKYINISKKIIPLIFSGFIDSANGTGNIRIKGSVYLQR